MAKSIKPEDIGKAIAEELTVYHEEVVNRVNNLSADAAKALVKKTKATAPVASGDYKKHIAQKLVSQNFLGNKIYAWFVRPPDHRLTHLLVHGHLTSKGDRTKEHSFLADACDEVLSDYEQKVEEAIRK
jgi:hypothetical protein